MESVGLVPGVSMKAMDRGQILQSSTYVYFTPIENFRGSFFMNLNCFMWQKIQALRGMTRKKT